MNERCRSSEVLTMNPATPTLTPAITTLKARATSDYDGDATGAGKHNVNSFENLPAPDNAWPFWGLRMGMSKDNFWTSANKLAKTLYPGSQVGTMRVLTMDSAVFGLVPLGCGWHDARFDHGFCRVRVSPVGLWLARCAF
jgi:hypothetical protein